MIFKNIRSLREDKDIRQKEIAAYLNVSQNTYSQYETGVIALTADILIKLSDYYDVSVDYLLDLTDNPERQKKNWSSKLQFFLFYDKKDGYESVTVSELIYWDNYEIDHMGRQTQNSKTTNTW